MDAAAPYLPGDEISYGFERMTVHAVGLTGGERYYWLRDKHKAILMVPASIVERSQATAQRTE